MDPLEICVKLVAKARPARRHCTCRPRAAPHALPECRQFLPCKGTHWTVLKQSCKCPRLLTHASGLQWEGQIGWGCQGCSVSTRCHLGPPSPWQASNLHRGQGHPNDGFHCPPVSNCCFHSWRHYAAQEVAIIRGVLPPAHSHHNDNCCRTRLLTIPIWSTIGPRICHVPWTLNSLLQNQQHDQFFMVHTCILYIVLNMYSAVFHFHKHVKLQLKGWGRKDCQLQRVNNT